MRLISRLVSQLLLALGGGAFSLGQNYGEVTTIKLHAAPVETAEAIQLRWPLREDLQGYTLRRLDPDGQEIRRTFRADSTGFTEEVRPGQRYRYLITGEARVKGTPMAQGYLEAGIAIPPDEATRRVLLVIEESLAEPLADSLLRWESDLLAEGWWPAREVVSAALPPPEVKEIIRRHAAVAGSPLSAAILVGHVAVPYSGMITPDGHPNSHLGAWPADVYYGDLRGRWSDETVEVTIGSPRNHNVPGDGKFDQSALANPVSVAIGRIDFSSLPAFAPHTELALTESYLARNHRFRQGQSEVAQEALIADGLGHLREAPSASAWRDAVALFGPSQIKTEAWFGEEPAPLSLLGYAGSIGGYGSLAMIGTTADLAARPSRCVFALLLGSYSGDWDNEDNFLRGTLASGATLAVSWSGRPALNLAGLATGRTIGECLREAQFPTAPLGPPSGFFSGSIHLSLLGDPTLKAHPRKRPTNLAGRWTEAGYELSWSPASSQEVGYRLYRAEGPGRPFLPLTPMMLAEASFLDESPASFAIYSVRPVALVHTGSGSFQSLGPGAVLEATAAPIEVTAREAEISEIGQTSGGIRLRRKGNLTHPLRVSYRLAGQAALGTDYAIDAEELRFAAGVEEMELAIVAQPDALVEGTEEIAFALVGGGPEDSTTATISLRDSPLAVWKLGHFGPEAREAEVAKDEADPDADGLANLIEYACGSDPLARTELSPLRCAWDDSQTPPVPRVTYRRDPTAVEVEVVLQSSPDLQSWILVSSEDAEVTRESEDTEVQVISLKPAAEGQRYYRLQVSARP